MTSPSKLICPTPTCNRVRLARCYARGIIRQPTPAYATKNRPRTGLQPSSDCSSADLRHGDLAHRYFRAIHAWRRGLMDGLRHGDPAHRCLSGILAWRRGHLSTLWHGDPQQNTPVVGARGKTVWNRCQTGLLPMLRPDFGTAAPARGLSVASWRGEAVIYWLFVQKMPLCHGH